MTVGLIGAMGLNSCELDEYNPSAGSSTIENFNTWAGLQTECYSTLYHELYSKEDFYFFSECGTDLWLNLADKDYAQQYFYYDGIGVANNQTKKTWQQAYAMIATCNSVINNAGGVSGGEGDAVKVLAAEAKVIRAFMHLTLTTYYGQITLCTNEVGTVEKNPKRNTLQEIYTSITTDLKEAAKDLNVEPYGGNYARVTKKTALGLLARAYAQGAGEGLTENGVSYWQRAKEVAEYMITNKAAYGLYLYDNVDDLWAQANNRNNKEALFVAAGLDAQGPDAGNASSYLNAQNYLASFTMTDPYTMSLLYNLQLTDNSYLGTTKGGGIMAPSKYAIDVFGDWDKRYENSFMTAFGYFTMEDKPSRTFVRQTRPLSSAILSSYGMNTALNGQKVYPYVALRSTDSPLGTQVIPVGVYEKGGTQNIVDTKNPFVIEQPLSPDEDRILVWLSKQKLTDEQKHQYKCFIMNIDDLFDADGNYRAEQWRPSGEKARPTNANKLFPSLIKYNALYNGSQRLGNKESRNGDVAIMRAAEVYMIAAEANVMLGNNGAAAQYLKPLRDRAARTGTAPALNNPTEQDILDEYAREFVGEHMRWAVLKRHHAIKSALTKHNKRAAANWKDEYEWRPIPQVFLDQISNKEEYGDNGYGYTANKGF